MTAVDALQQLIDADRHLHDTGRRHGRSPQLRTAYEARETALDHAIAAGHTAAQLRAALEAQ